MSQLIAILFAPVSRKRGLAAIAVLLVAAVVAGAVGSWMLRQLPDPATASREAIFRHLVLADVRQQPMATQVALVNRLERELEDGIDPSDVVALSAARQTTLERNISALKQLWFVKRVGQYYELAAEQRNAFMDQRVATVLAWSNLEVALGQGPSYGRGNDSSAAVFFDDIERWVIDETDAALQAKMETAVYDGVVRWLARHSLNEQPLNVRTELARRIARQLDAGLQLHQIQHATADEAKMLRRNCELLMEAWLREQAREYFTLAPADQASFVAEKIDSVTNWGVLEILSADMDGAQPPNPSQGFVRLLALTEEWIERAPSQDRAQLRGLVAAVQAQMLLRVLKPGG